MKPPISTPPMPDDPIAQQMVSHSLNSFKALRKSMAAKPAPREETPVRHLGVLLVHGIGNQKRGKTLTQFGEPLFLFLESWLTNHSGGAELERVSLRDEPGRRRTPAHAVVRLWHKGAAQDEADDAAPVGPDNAAQEGPDNAAQDEVGSPPAGPRPPDETRWLLAESTWADVFEQPSFGTVATWSLRVVPLFILTQFVDQLSDDLRNGRLVRAALSFSYLVLTFPLALLIQLIVLLLLPLSLLPPLRPVVSPIQRWISAVIGDTYVLMTSRFQFQSMVSTVRDDLAWLADRCDVVAVLAHSQGAAVAHEAVRQAHEPKVERLITFGSAVSRLKALRFVMEHAPDMLTASMLVTISASALTGLFLWSLLSGSGSLLQLVFGFWGLGTALAISAYLMPFSLKQINERCHANQEFGLDSWTKWEDYYATSDPVPNGKMLSDDSQYTSKSVEVHNRANLFTDHSGYWKNKDEFGSNVLHALMTLTGGPFETNGVPPRVSTGAGDDRALRTRHRVLARGAAVLALSVAVFQHPKLKDGVRVPEPLQLPLGWLASFVNWLLVLAGDALGLVGSKLKLTSADLTLPHIQRPVDLLSWPVACVFLVLVWMLLSGSILSWWEKSETEGRFRENKPRSAGKPLIASWASVSVLGLAWLSFWVWWLVLSPADMWAQIGARFEPLVKSTGGGSVVWVLIGYQFIESIKKAFESQREITEQVMKRSSIQELLDAENRPGSVFGKIPRYNLPGMPGYVALPPQERSSFLSIFGDEIKDLSKRLSGTRDFSPGVAAGIAVLLALGSLAIVVFNFHIRGAVVQAALGLVALAFGVLGWVRGTGRATRVAAAVGMVGGVVVMPWAEAINAGVGSVTGVGLLTAGLVCGACAVGAAECLRRAWAAIEHAHDSA